MQHDSLAILVPGMSLVEHEQHHRVIGYHCSAEQPKTPESVRATETERTMTIEEAFASDTKAPVRHGAIGRELPDWYDIGTFEVKSGNLTVVDFGVFTDRDGVTIQVPVGTYRAQVKIMSFDGSLGVCRARAVPDILSDVQRGSDAGRVAVDMAKVAIGDVFDVARHLNDADRPEIRRRVKASRGVEGAIVRFDVGAGSFEVACVASGFGDGAYPVTALTHAGAAVGMEIEFVKDGHVYEKPQVDKAALLAKLEALRSLRGGPLGNG